MILDVVRLPDNVSCLEPFVAAGILGATEVHVASFVLEQSEVDDAHVAHAAAAATWAMLHGHDCADLGVFADVVDAARRREHADDAESLTPVTWPTAQRWVAALRAPAVSSAVRVADRPDEVLDDRPLVVCGDRVYLQRLWIDECVVARAITHRARERTPTAGITHLLDTLLPAHHPTTGEPDLQRAAAEAVLRSGVAVIAGGPGTGKTYSVARVLAALVEDSRLRGDPAPSVALTAPTGKAARRLAETIEAAAGSMSKVVSAETITHLTDIVPTTIHRLLGALGTTGRFRHDASHPLPHEIVIVDETSMASLPLMARLLDALRPDARVVLVGDPGQLESVQEGAILGDLVTAGSTAEPGHPLHGRVVELTANHRFGGASPIHGLATLIRTSPRSADDARPAIAEFVAHARAQHTAQHADQHTDQHDQQHREQHDEQHGEQSTVTFVDVDVATDQSAVAAVRAMVEPSLVTMRDAAQRGDAVTALAALSEVRILCAHRRGPAGVSAWNRLAEQWVRGAQSGRGDWYAGRPVLITRNDPRLGLSNGDTGVAVRDGERLVVAFPRAQADPVTFSTSALADIDTCFAMTVHKSQGSEYVSVALILPPERSPLIGRELAYTGVTRARNHLLVVGSPAVLAACAASPAERMTGLRQSLGAR